MFKRLMPKTADFFVLFEQHTDVIVETVVALDQMAPNIANIKATAEYIRRLEHRADSVTHECLDKLHKTFITPMDRGDIKRLMSGLDDIVDFICGATNRMDLYNIDTIPPNVKYTANLLLKSGLLVKEIVGDIKNYSKQGVVENIFKKCIEVKSLESECDTLHRKAIVELYDNEKDIISVLKWREIYDKLERCADACERVAELVEGTILELS